MNTSIIKPIKGYENSYGIDSEGVVYSCFDNNLKIRKLSTDKGGYLVVTLYSKNKSKQFKVHRLVASAFIDNPENKKCVNHKDGNKKNNNISNLEWCTHGENKSHSFRVLNEKHWHKGKTGKSCKYSKVLQQIEISTGKVLATYHGTHDAHRITGISQGNISAVCRGSRHHAGGYFWRYV